MIADKNTVNYAKKRENINYLIFLKTRTQDKKIKEYFDHSIRQINFELFKMDWVDCERADPNYLDEEIKKCVQEREDKEYEKFLSQYSDAKKYCNLNKFEK